MWSAPLSMTLFLLTIQFPAFLFHFDAPEDSTRLEEGLYVPADSAGYLFTQVYFDPANGSLKTYIACEDGDCDHLTFELTEFRQAYYSMQVNNSLGWKTEICMTASDGNEMIMLARISYPDATPQRIIQKFVRKQ